MRGGRFAGNTTALLERERERTLVADLLESAAAGEAAAAVIEGDAGLGKSSLLEMTSELALERGFTVLRARGGSLERTLGWGVARQLFEPVLARASAQERDSLLEGSAALAGAVLGFGPSNDAEPSSANDFRFEHGLYWLVSNLTERGPVALLIDDAHWCDDATLEWLLYLLRRSEQLPLLAVITRRTGEPGAPTALLREMAAEPITTTASLAALGVDGTGALLEQTYSASVDPEFALACHTWTGGNPLFVTELAAELVAEGIGPVEASAARVSSLTPQGASRVTLLRLARLSAPALELARAVAVLEPAATLHLAATLAGLSEHASLAALDELTEARVLDGSHPLTFLHPLIGGIVYEDLPPAWRAALHKQAAHLLIDAGAEPGRIAAHLARTTPAGDPWVVAQLLWSGEIELGRGSPSTATELLQRAKLEPPAPDQSASVLFALGRAQSLAGDRAGFATLDEALRASTDVVQRAEIALALGRVHVRAGEPDAAITTVAGAAEELGWLDSDLRLQLEAMLLTLARFAGSRLELISQRQDMIRDRAGSDSHGGRLVAGQLAWSCSARAISVAQTIELARAAIASGRLISEARDTPEAWLGPIHVLALADELDEADGYWREALRLAEQHGSSAAFAAASCYRAATAYMRGRLDEAELYARDSLRTTTGALSLVHGIASAHLAQALIDRGAVSDAYELLGPEKLIDQPRSHAWTMQMMFAAGRVLVAMDQVAEGAAVLLDTGKRARAAGVLNPAWLAWRSQAALALHQLGDRDEAIRLCGEELELAQQFGSRRPIGAALRARGLIEGGEQGLEALRQSVATLAESPASLEYARSLVALGGALRRTNQRADAREVLGDGLRLAESCGAGPLAHEARAELKASGARPRALLRIGADALTASERRVCELAAAGKSNPEIAQLLFVTRATVESHLHSAYRRLGISSRKELAAALGGEAASS